MATEAPLPTRRIEPWQMLTAFDPKSRQLDYCTAEAQFADGRALAFQRDPGGRMQLIADFGRPLMKAGERTDVTLAVDMAVSRKLLGEAVNSTSLSIAIGSDPEIAASIARGTILTLRSAGSNVTLDLDGAGAALSGLARCVASPLSVPRGDMAIGIIETVASGPVQMSRDEGSNIEYAWTVEAIAASARAVPMAASEQFLDLALSRLDRIKARCDGHLSPEMGAPTESAGTISESAIAACRGASGGDRFAALFFVARDGRFLEFDLETDGAHRDAAIALRDRVAAEARRGTPPQREFNAIGK